MLRVSILLRADRPVTSSALIFLIFELFVEYFFGIQFSSNLRYTNGTAKKEVMLPFLQWFMFVCYLTTISASRLYQNVEVGRLMTVEQLIEVIGENLSQRHFVHH
jgi:hypothetical protein